MILKIILFSECCAGDGEVFRLIECEMWKLKRKKLIRAAFFTAILFPVISSLLLADADLADIMSGVREDSGFLLLIPIMVILAAYLFFDEHNNDTLKNLMCIPVAKSRLATAKLSVLLFFSIAYELCGYIIGILIAIGKGISTDGLWLQLYLTFWTAIFLWAATLPCIILVVWVNRSYIISGIIAFFYALLGYALHLSDAVMMKPLGLNITTLIPVPVIFRWLYQYTVPEGKTQIAFYRRFSPYFISTPVVFLIMFAEAAICIFIMNRIYQKQKV